MFINSCRYLRGKHICSGSYRLFASPGGANIQPAARTQFTRHGSEFRRCAQQEATTCNVIGRGVNLKRSLRRKDVDKKWKINVQDKNLTEFCFFSESLRPWNFKRMDEHGRDDKDTCLFCKAFTVIPFFTRLSLKVENPVFFFFSAVATCASLNVCRICYAQAQLAIGPVGLCSCEAFVGSLEMYIQVALGMPGSPTISCGKVDNKMTTIPVWHTDFSGLDTSIFWMVLTIFELKEHFVRQQIQVEESTKDCFVGKTYWTWLPSQKGPTDQWIYSKNHWKWAQWNQRLFGWLETACRIITTIS